MQSFSTQKRKPNFKVYDDDSDDSLTNSAITEQESLESFDEKGEHVRKKSFLDAQQDDLA